jgi:hypothetical protein
MPHVTLPLTAGKPLVEVRIGVSFPRAKAMMAAGLTPPQAIPARGLIDTGSNCTSIDSSIIQLLNLEPAGDTTIITPSTGVSPHQCVRYEMSLSFNHPTLTFVLPAIPAVACPLLHQGIHVLLGLNVLAHCFFAYDGHAKTFILAF